MSPPPPPKDEESDEPKMQAKNDSQQSFKLLLLVLMVLQNSSTVLVGRHSRSSVPKEDLYVVNHLIIVTELGKVRLQLLLLVAYCLLCVEQKRKAQQSRNAP
jgi:hypothetical protein